MVVAPWLMMVDNLQLPVVYVLPPLPSRHHLFIQDWDSYDVFKPTTHPHHTLSVVFLATTPGAPQTASSSIPPEAPSMVL